MSNDMLEKCPENLSAKPDWIFKDPYAKASATALRPVSTG